MEELSERFDRMIEHVSQVYRDSHFGRSIAGQRLLHTTRMARRVGGGAVRALARTRVGRAIGSKVRSAGSAIATKVQARFRPPVPAATGAQAGAAATAGAEAGGAAAGAQGAAASAGLGAGGTAAAAVAAPIVIFTAAVGGAALAVWQMQAALHRASEELEDLSPEIASARAEMEMMHEIARLDRAGRVGAAAANIEAARGRISESMYELQTKMLEILAKGAPTIEAILDSLNVGVRTVDLGVANAAVVMEFLKDKFMGDVNPQNNAAAQQWADAASKAFAEAMKELQQRTDPTQAHVMDPLLASVLDIDLDDPNGPQAPHQV